MPTNMMKTGSNNNQNSGSEGLFNVSLVLYDASNREYVIGNAQLPVEDLTDAIANYNEEVGGYNFEQQRTILSRVLFLYGTNYSQRENCIIGKVALDITYRQERQILTVNEAKRL